MARRKHTPEQVIKTLRKAQVLTPQCRQTYNGIRPHSSLFYRPPAPAAFLPAEAIPIQVGLI